MSSVACCFGAICETIDESQCIARGGEVKSDIFGSSYTSCAEAEVAGKFCDRQACCLPSPQGCSDLEEADCREFGGTPRGRGTRCNCIPLNPNGSCAPNTGDVVVACCFGGVCSEVTSGICVNCGGNVSMVTDDFGTHPVYQCELSECADQPPPEPEGCIQARDEDQYPPNVRGWTTDLCVNGIFGPTLRTTAYPGGPFEAGYHELSTRRPARMVDQPAGAEPCLQQWGQLVVDRDGYVRPIGCNKRYASDGNGVLCRGDGVILNETFLDETIERGYAYWAVPYQAPHWTEVQFGSRLKICTQVV